MRITIILLLFIATLLCEGCTPSMNLRVNHSNIDTVASDLQLSFEFERKREPLDLWRVWIYKEDLLVLDMEKVDAGEAVRNTWNFPSIPEGFRITYPENLNAMPAFRKKDHLRFNFLAGGAYSQWEYKPNS